MRFDIIFYVCRMASSQKERDFRNTCYDDIKRVYSIWVCLNMSENSMAHIHLMKDELLGSYDWKGKLDLLNIVMIGLAKELPEHAEQYELHRLLGALLSKTLTADEKLNIIGSEYNIPMEDSLKERVSVMCNLSQGIKEDAMAIGEERGRALGEAVGEERGRALGEAGIIINMYNNSFTAEKIAEVMGKALADVEAIIAGRN